MTAEMTAETLASSLMPTLAMWTPGPLEMVIILVLGVLIFGRRLPEVGRSLGRGIVEFKKGIKGIEDEVDDATRTTSSSSSSATTRTPDALPQGSIDPAGQDAGSFQRVETAPREG